MEDIADIEYKENMISFRLFQHRSLVILEFVMNSRTKESHFCYVEIYSK